MIMIMIIIIIISFICLIIYNKYREDFILSNKNIQLSPKLSSLNIQNLHQAQYKIYNMMQIFHNICEKYNIRYILGYGTLLGAILYNGWIPWNGDSDIMVDERDFDKLRTVLITELPKYQLWYQDNLIDKNYKSSTIMKIRDLNSCYLDSLDYSTHHGLQIDLTKYKFIDNKLIVYDNNKLTTITYNDIYPTKLHKFEDSYFYIPNNYINILNARYGNKWNIILPIESRYPHEGAVDPNNPCNHHKKIYPHLYQ